MPETIPNLQTLDEFIEELSAQRSLHGKVRLLAHYWKQIRDLPSEDRQRVALALGSKAAWRHLEKLFAADGQLSEGELTVKRALEQVGSAEPEELRALAGQLRSGDYAEAGSDLIAVVGQVLEDEADKVGEPAPTVAESPSPGMDPAPAPEPVASESADGAVDAPRPAAVEAVPAPRPGPEPASEAVQAPGHDSVVPELEPELAEREARSERRRLVTAAAAGWRRRRLLGGLIREGQLAGLEEALELAALLESDVQRAWCLADLVQHWSLDEEQVARLLDAAPSASVRGRLLRRLGRSAATDAMPTSPS